MFTVLRAFLPSEQAWAFQWLFNSVFPQLLGKKALSDVKIMVTDGDAQETSQLDYAIKNTFHRSTDKGVHGTSLIDHGRKN